MGKIRFSLEASLLPFATLAVGQSVTLSLGSNPGSAGAAVALPVVLSTSGTVAPSALEFTFSYTSDITGVTVAAGGVATTANKSVSCSGNTCLVWGLDSTTISGGIVAVATFQVAANPSTNTIPIQITNVIVSDGNGNPIPGSGSPGSITLSSTPVVALSNLACTPTTFYTPGTSTCTVTLSSSAATGGFNVPLSSGNASLTVPASVTVTAGQNTAQFTATAVQVASSQTGTVTAGTGATAHPFNLTLDPPVTLNSVSCAPTSLGSSASTTCTVTLNESALANTTVSLRSNNAALTVGSSVTVPSGQSSATFPATTGILTSTTTTSAIVTATLGSQNPTAAVTLQIPTSAATLTSVACTPQAIGANSSSSCTVTLNQAATANTTVSVGSNNSSLTVPSSVTVLSGQSTANFTATTGQLTFLVKPSVIITATLGSQNLTTTVALLLPGTTTLTSINCVPSAIGSNASSTCTVTLNEAATANMTVLVGSNNPALSVPASVTIASGNSSTTFSATTGTLTTSTTPSARVTATVNSVSLASTVTLQIPTTATTLTSVNCAPSTLGSNASSTCTVALNQSATANTTVSVSSNNAALTVPPSVTVLSGQSTATFSATTGTLTSTNTPSATVTATLGSQSPTSAITLQIPAPTTLTSVSCAPSSIGSNASSTCTVTLNQSATANTSVSVSSNNAALSVPSSVTVPSGQSSATFSATTGTLTSNNTPSATVTATLGSQSPTFTVTLQTPGPTTLASVNCAPSTIGSNASSTCTVTLNQNATANTPIAVSSGNAALSVPTSVIVLSGHSSATFSATTGTLTSSNTASAIVTAMLGSQSPTFTVTLQIPPATMLMSVGCTPMMIGANSSSTCTVTLNQAAASNTTVTLQSNNVALTVPSNVTVLAGQSTANFSATTGALTGSITPSATITATLGSQNPTVVIGIQMPATTLNVVSCTPSTIGSNAASTCTVFLNQAATANTAVALSSNNAALTVPAGVTVLTGQISATFSATTGTLNSTNAASAIVTATLGSQSPTTTITLQVPPGSLSVSSVGCSPAAIAASSTTTCTVTLNQTATTNTTVTLKSSTGMLNIPASVTIPSGSTSAAFSATAGLLTALSPSTATLTATLGSQNATAIIILQIPITGVQMNTFTCFPATIAPNTSTNCTVMLNHSTIANTTISLKSASGTVTVPVTLVVLSGKVSASFTATAGALNSSVGVTATLNGQVLSTTIKPIAPSPTVTSIMPPTLPVGVYRITVKGAGFDPDSVVSLGGSPLATRFVSETLLTATGYATDSHSANLSVSSGSTTSDPIEIQTGVAQPRLSYTAAARFLQQASFGPQPESIMHLQQTGIQDWLEEQFNMPAVSSPDQALATSAIQNPDQLRQRVSLALGQTAATNVFANYRQILGNTQTAPADSLDSIFNQPSTGTQVAVQLIQSLVKANPSPEYTQRVAAVFNQNGVGVRGDMRSVVSAVLLDPEARAGDVPGNDGANTGRLQEDGVFVPGVLRALNAPATAAIGLATQPRAQWIASVLDSSDLTPFADLAATAESLANALDVAFLGGQMSSQMKQSLTSAIDAETGGNLKRAQLGVFLVTTSSEYNVRH